MNKKTIANFGLLFLTTVLVLFIYKKIFWIFGLSAIVIPVLFYFNKKYIFYFFLIGYLLDIFNFFSYSILGSFGEIAWTINHYTYSIPLIFVAAILIYTKKQTKEDLFDERNEKVKNNLSQEKLVNQLLLKYSIDGYVQSSQEGPFVTRYNLVISNVSKLRFEGLSVEFAIEMGLKVLNCYNYNECQIDIENKYKNVPIFKETYEIKQPNNLSLFDSQKNPVLLKYFRNLYCNLSESAILSILTGILITKVGVDVLVFNCPFPQFSNVFDFIYENEQYFLEEIINEMNRRYAMMLPYGRTMDEYESIEALENIKDFKRFPRKIIIFFSIERIDLNYIEYIIKYGESVGIYVYSMNVTNNEESDFAFMDMFNAKIIGPQKNDIIKESEVDGLVSEVIYTSKLCHEHDCFFISESSLLRIVLPKTSINEQHRLIAFFNNLHSRYN